MLVLQCHLKSFHYHLLNPKLTRNCKQLLAKVEEEIMKNDPQLLQFPELPEQGIDADNVSLELDKLQNLKHSDWINGRVSGAVYHGGENLLSLQVEAYKKYSVANQLHPDVFPGVRKMEAEVVHMVLISLMLRVTGVDRQLRRY